MHRPLEGTLGAHYSFTTHWRAAAPIERVFDAIYRPLEWPNWWKGVEAVEELRAGDDLGVGAIHRYTWKSKLPYRLAFDMQVTAVEKPRRLEGLASGELEGMGVWTLTEDRAFTDIRYKWDIQTTRSWMNSLSWLLRPAFAWNHDWVMNSGARGLAKLLDCEVEVVGEERRSRRRWLPYIGAGAGLATVLFWRRRRRRP